MSTSTNRIEANRRNARKSTGPRTPEGKNRSRFNAVKHGITARTPVLPGEDEAAYRERLDAWKGDLKPRGAVEDYLVERAVQVSWQLDRADRAQAAHLSARARSAGDERSRCAADEVLELGHRLFWDPRGPICDYPHPDPFLGGLVRVSWSRDIDDPNHPARVVNRLEGSALGCAWMLDRWGELQGLLDDGRKWQPPDRLRAVRLLGKQPLDAPDDPRVLSVYLACWAMDPDGPHGFDDQSPELGPAERTRFIDRLNGRDAQSRMPADPEAGRTALRAMVAEEVARLEDLLAAHLERDAAAGVDRLEFDDSESGERLRRYQLAGNRTLLRVLQVFFKVRREADTATEDAAPPSIPTEARTAEGASPPPARSMPPCSEDATAVESGNAGDLIASLRATEPPSRSPAVDSSAPGAALGDTSSIGRPTSTDAGSEPIVEEPAGTESQSVVENLQNEPRPPGGLVLPRSPTGSVGRNWLPWFVAGLLAGDPRTATSGETVREIADPGFARLGTRRTARTPRSRSANELRLVARPFPRPGAFPWPHQFGPLLAACTPEDLPFVPAARSGRVAPAGRASIGPGAESAGPRRTARAPAGRTAPRDGPEHH